MKFTFGIITDGTQLARVAEVIHSIRTQTNLHLDNFEIIVVGGQELTCGSHTIPLKHIPFVEADRAWITRKKNLITANAMFDNIVYMHDYIALDKHWYDNFCKFEIAVPSNYWDVVMTTILNKDGSRYRDWVIWDDPEFAGHPQTALPPYTYDKQQFMYVSGAYWVAKKYVMETIPLNENLYLGDGEDVEWSKRMREVFKYRLNENSVVKLLKQKDVISRRC